MRADDYFAIQRLIHHYFHLVDDGDFDAAGTLFARADLVYPAGGRTISCDGAAVAALMRSFVKLHGPDHRTMTRHHCGNLIIEPDDAGRALTRCSAIIFQAAPGFPLQPIAVASYRDRLVKAEGSWHFTRREVELSMMGDLSQHLLRAV